MCRAPLDNGRLAGIYSSTPSDAWAYRKLVWIETKDNNILNVFRPSDDGSLLNLDDDEITLSTDSYIKLAHAALVSEDERKAWITHFKDYKVKFLFSQMEHKVPDLDLKLTEIEDRKGWLTDTYTLRGVLTKMGYQRGQAEDGGSFTHYAKHFASLGFMSISSLVVAMCQRKISQPSYFH